MSNRSPRVPLSPVVLLLLGLSPALFTGCASTGESDANLAFTPPGKPQLFEGMGTHRRPADTNSTEAQKYFDQALTLMYAFNHDEAIRSYTRAAEIDPNFAMAWWGVALCHGPHINNPAVPPERARAAWDALQKALARKDSARPVDRALIEALAKRYSADSSADRHPLDEAYAAAMRTVYAKFATDNDVATLYVESLMDLQPWDLWTHDGKPKGSTTEIVAVLESVMARDPKHPGANHLYIHAVEASPFPDKANAAADRLRTLVPASGHLVHMPAHIDVRVGRWSLAADQNVHAIDTDKRYRELAPRQGFYRIYMAHNHHFLAYASMMEGRSAAALAAAREMVAGVPAEFIDRNAPVVDAYASIIMEVLMRFGRWDDILNEPAPPAKLPITTSMWHFTRAIAFAAKGKTIEAEQEQGAFRAAANRVPKDAMMAINPAHTVLSIAELVLSGEISYRKGDVNAAVASLRKAAEIEDTLKYMEPPDWVHPARHPLGAILLAAGRASEAEEVYREDLKRWPENGWSLYGLAQCLRARGANTEAAEVEKRFEKAWSRADTKLTSSCKCVANAP